MESESDFKDFQGWGNWNQNWINIFWGGIGIRIELNIVWLEWELNWNQLLPELDMTDLGENVNMISLLHVSIIMNYQYYHWSLSLSPLFFCNFVTFVIWHSSTKSHSIHVAVSCGYDTCFAVGTCDELYHFIFSIDRVGILRNRPYPPWNWSLACHHPITLGWLPQFIYKRTYSSNILIFVDRNNSTLDLKDM